MAEVTNFYEFWFFSSIFVLKKGPLQRLLSHCSSCIFSWVRTFWIFPFLFSWVQLSHYLQISSIVMKYDVSVRVPSRTTTTSSRYRKMEFFYICEERKADALIHRHFSACIHTSTIKAGFGTAIVRTQAGDVLKHLQLFFLYFKCQRTVTFLIIFCLFYASVK